MLFGDCYVSGVCVELALGCVCTRNEVTLWVGWLQKVLLSVIIKIIQYYIWDENKKNMKTMTKQNISNEWMSTKINMKNSENHFHLKRKEKSKLK